MKKIILILSVVCSFTLNAQSKIAHVDSQRLLDSLPSYNKAEKELQKFQEDGLILINGKTSDFKEFPIIKNSEGIMSRCVNNFK